MITVNGKDRSWREGMTVTDLLRDIHDSYPYAVIRINETRITKSDFDKTLIPDNSKIFLIPMIAGG